MGSRYFCVLMLGAILFTGGCSSSSDPMPAISGEWSGGVRGDDGTETTQYVTIVQKDAAVEVFLGNPPSEDLKATGAISGRTLTISWPQAVPDSAAPTGIPDARVTATIEHGDDYMEGTVSLGNPLKSYKFYMTRRPSAASLDNNSNMTITADEKSKGVCTSYAKINSTTPATPVADKPTQVPIGSLVCDVSGNSDAGLNTMQNVTILTHPTDENVYFPGALWDGGHFLSSLEPVLLDVGRGSGNQLSLSDANFSGNGTYTISGPVTATSVQQGMNELKKQITASAANFDATAYTADSQSNLAFQLGLGFEYKKVASANLDVKYDWTVASNYASYFAKQTYYTINFVEPTDATGKYDRARFFSSDTDACAFLSDKTKPPVYLSSVSYGRMLLAVASSSHSSSDMKEAMESSVTYKDASLKVSSGLTVGEVMSSTSITYIVYGGSGGSVAKSLQPQPGTSMVDAWHNLVADTASAEYSATNPGVPIYYTLKNVADRTLVDMPFAVSFDSRYCHQPSPPATYSWKVSVSNIKHDIYLCINDSEKAHVETGRDFDITQWMTTGNDTLSLTVGNAGCGKTHADMSLYRKKNDGRSDWQQIWGRDFSSDHPHTCGWQYQKVMLVNKDGSSDVSADPKYEGKIWNKGAKGRCAGWNN